MHQSPDRRSEDASVVIVFLCVVMIVLLIALDCQAQTSEVQIRLVVKNALERHVVVTTENNALCSGIILETNRILTAKHCWEQPGKVQMFVNGKPAKVLKISETDDLCLLDAPTVKLSKIKFANPSLTEPVVIIGNPGTDKLGLIEFGRINYFEKRTFNTTFKGAPGFSGGGCWNYRGQLVGMMRGFYGVQNFVVAGEHVGSSAIKEFLK